MRLQKKESLILVYYMSSKQSAVTSKPEVNVQFGPAFWIRMFFWASWVRIRIYLCGSGSGFLHQQTKKWRKTLISLFSSFKNNVNIPSKRNKHKNFEKNINYVGVLKVTDEKIRIRSRIRQSNVRILGYGSVQKCNVLNTAFALYMTSMNKYIL